MTRSNGKLDLCDLCLPSHFEDKTLMFIHLTDVFIQAVHIYQCVCYLGIEPMTQAPH